MAIHELAFMPPTPYAFMALAAVLLALGFVLYRAASPKPIPGIPYYKPSAGRLFGDIPDVMEHHAKTQEMIGFLRGRCLELNSPIIQIFARPFSKPWVILCDAQETIDITARRTREFDRSNFVSNLFKETLPHFQIAMKTTDEWRSNRKLMGDTMSPRFLNTVARTQIYSATLDLIELWQEKMRLAKGHSFEVSKDVQYNAFEAIWACAFGSKIGVTSSQAQLLSKVDKLDVPSSKDEGVTYPLAPLPADFEAPITVAGSCEIPMHSPFFPLLIHRLALKFGPTLSRAVKRKDKLIRDKLDTAWQKFSQTTANDDDVRSAADLVVQREVQMAKKEGRRPQYKSPAVQDELMGFLFAGHETSAVTMCWGYKYLTQHQEVQNKLRSALQASFPRALAEGDNPTADEIVNANIPYLDATLEEVLRFGCPAPTIVRTATMDTEILGHRIPKGTDVFMLLIGPSYLMAPFQIDQKKRTASSQQAKDNLPQWDNSDVEQFKPERWLIQNEKGETEFNWRAGPENTFGNGPRGCFGKKLAYIEMRLIYALIFWNFKLTSTPPALSTMASKDVTTRCPKKMYIRLEKV